MDETVQELREIKKILKDIFEHLEQVSNYQEVVVRKDEGSEMVIKPTSINVET